MYVDATTGSQRTVVSIERVPMTSSTQAALGQISQSVDVEAVLAVWLEAGDCSAHTKRRVGVFWLDEDDGSTHTGVFAVGGRWAEDGNGGVGGEGGFCEELGFLISVQLFRNAGGNAEDVGG